MKFISIFSLLCIALIALAIDVQANDDDQFEEDLTAANQFLKRTLFHPGSTKCEEQKREAREDYEERCEPSLPLLRNTGSGRFCPDINQWTEFRNYEIGNGFETRPQSTTPRYEDRPRRPPPIVPDPIVEDDE